MTEHHHSEESRNLLQRYQEGDEQAAEEIFNRYLQRLVQLASGQLSEKLRRRVAPEDIVQSVFRSFFGKAQDGRFSLERAGDLWRLLATITKHKLLKKAEHHRQQKRSIKREQALAADSSVGTADLFAVEPTELEGLALADEVELLMSELDSHQRTMLELRLQGKSLPEIAETVERSERTVRRFLGGMRDRLEERLRELGT